MFTGLSEQQLQIIKRMRQNQDTADFIESILKPEFHKNHISLLATNKEGRDELIGEGRCLSLLINLFIDIDNKLCSTLQKEVPNRI